MTKLSDDTPFGGTFKPLDALTILGFDQDLDRALQSELRETFKAGD